MQIWKLNNNKWRHSQKQWQNSDLLESKKIIYHSKGIDESYPKMYFLLNLSHYVKLYGHFCNILAFLRFPLTKYVHVTWPKKQISKIFYFVLILHLILGKVTKFLVEKLSTSEVISQKPHGGWKTPPPRPLPVPLRLNEDSKCLFKSEEIAQLYLL